MSTFAYCIRVIDDPGAASRNSTSSYAVFAETPFEALQLAVSDMGEIGFEPSEVRIINMDTHPEFDSIRDYFRHEFVSAPEPAAAVVALQEKLDSGVIGSLINFALYTRLYKDDPRYKERMDQFREALLP